ncbi:MAG: peptide-methionine (R)-S-oxide reductase MsrB [Pseudomonadota bacterium]
MFARRQFIAGAGALGLMGALIVSRAASDEAAGGVTAADKEKWALSEKEWRARLTPDQFRVLRKEGTERPFTSPLNDEKRAGVYACAGCGLELFTSDQKFDSGTGWPSFFDVIPGRIETKTDFKLVYPRTDYHCARCGGHQGHVFKDGPAPTGLRYCNNGVALSFRPTAGVADEAAAEDAAS